MSSLRFKALEVAQNRPSVELPKTSNRISDYFGMWVFDKPKMKSYMSANSFKALAACIDTGTPITPDIADAVAAAMKTWAVEKGATHFTHWFQPLRGTTAEKHDAFFDLNAEGDPIERFKGNDLIRQEPDASSFPSGGLRNTFEARGYTAWDAGSPAFLMEIGGGTTLCIPSIFVAYTGEALDYKVPLLKSLNRLNTSATRVCQFFDKNVERVVATLGIEQEYFVVDEALFNARPDLFMANRTLLGHSPAKGQQLEDHYFGSIPTRVKDFIQDFEVMAHKLGIPVVTRHNEVAPSQFECAPLFEEVGIAIDHNILLMDIMERVAERHKLKVLFHEKPFAGVNGSGKHNNWSMSTNTGRNLLSPTSKAKDNLQFLTFFVSTIKAVHVHADLLRASIASAYNDHRLGANEAPPAIMSVFIGTQLTEVLDELEKNAKVDINKGDNMYMKLGIDKIPAILLDNTDRNRTSPFAFTGNKFEFRAVGSSANSADPMTVLNTIVADQLGAFADEVDALVEKGEKKELAIIQVLRRYISESKAIRFEGNNYSEEWEIEAKKRGLSNVKETPGALEAFIAPSTVDLYHRHSILSEHEIEARLEIRYEKYLQQIQIESRLIGDIAQNHIVPVAIEYQNRLIQNVQGLIQLGMDEEVALRKETIRKISKHIEIITTHIREMIRERKLANDLHSKEAAFAYCEKVKPHFEIIRKAADKLELLVDDAMWPLPKYREILFVR